jgi:hypothetical protein
MLQEKKTPTVLIFLKENCPFHGQRSKRQAIQDFAKIIVFRGRLGEKDRNI